MAYKDVRQYVSALEEHGELRRVKREVDWDLEAGAIMRFVSEKSLPAPLFQKIKGYPSGYTIFGCPMNTFGKFAIAMGLNPETSRRELEDIYRQRISERVKPIIVDKSKAPCKENIDVADQVDLFKFPAPMLHDGDGGRYLCTWHVTITKDPDTGWVNWGMYRQMIRDKNSLVGVIRPAAHIGVQFYRKYKPGKLPMPFAIAIGTEPISSFVAACKLPMNVNEADIAGALRQEPVELVKCETTDLEVPATSEIVIEGEISATEEDWEGPFGEYTGYCTNPRDKKPVYHVKAVSYRDNPILTASCMGTPVDESDIVQSISRSAQILAKLQESGIAVVAVNVAPECIGYLVVVSVMARVAQIPNLAHRVASCIWGSAVGGNIPYVIVVDDDVDVYNLQQVLHAVVTKCHPYRGISRVESATGMAFMPFLSPYERSQRLSAKVVFDCTWPLHWDPVTDVPTKTSFDTAYPKEIRDHVLKNWESYGFDRLY